MVASWATTAATAVMSSVVGEGTFIQRLPLSVVSRMVPARPTTQQVWAEGAEPASRSAATPVFCTVQVAPASAERWTIPEGRRRHITSPSGEETSWGLRGDGKSAALLKGCTLPRFARDSSVAGAPVGALRADSFLFSSGMERVGVSALTMEFEGSGAAPAGGGGATRDGAWACFGQITNPPGWPSARGVLSGPEGEGGGAICSRAP